MERDNFNAFKDITHENNENLFNQLMNISKGNMDLALETYFETIVNISNSNTEKRTLSEGSDGNGVYIGYILTNAISLSNIYNAQKLTKFYYKISLYKEQKTGKKGAKENKNIDKIIRLTMQQNGFPIAKLYTKESDIFYPLLQTESIKLEIESTSNFTVTTLADIPVKISIYLMPSIFCDPSATANDEAHRRKIPLEDYSIQLMSIKSIFSLIDLKKTQNALAVKDKNEDESISELKSEEKSQCLQNLDILNIIEVTPASSFTTKLFKYQAQALAWMIEREIKNDSSEQLHFLWDEYTLESGLKLFVHSCTSQISVKFPSSGALCKGGILADEMGLGKTVMMIALIHTNKLKRVACKQVKHSNQAGTLIITPLSLMSQWRAELELHGCGLTILEYHDDKHKPTLNNLKKADVILTTYGMVNSECSKNGLLFQLSWFRIILDEAHAIKNKNTITAKSNFKLKAEYKWALTGTPVQNTIDDLFPLARFLEYEPWSDYTFWSKIITQKFQKKTEDCFSLLHKVLKPIMLRRTKESKINGQPIISLPSIEVSDVKLSLSPEDREKYEQLVVSCKDKYKSLMKPGKVIADITNVFELLLRLRQFCNHPLLIKSRGDVKNPEKLEEFFARHCKNSSSSYIKNLIDSIRNGIEDCCPICISPLDDAVITKCTHLLCRFCAKTQINIFKNCPFCKVPLTMSDIQTLPRESKFSVDLSKSFQDSVKTKFLIEFLLENPEKTVVFTQWTSMLDLLEVALRRAGISFCRLDGSLSRVQREESISEFKSNTRVIIMSLRAGCLGLNLTCANQLVLLDPWWNPSVERQAIERVHRIGQLKNVKVIRVLVENSIEDHVLNLQKMKESIIEGAFVEQTCSLNLENIRYIFESL